MNARDDRFYSRVFALATAAEGSDYERATHDHHPLQQGLPTSRS